MFVPEQQWVRLCFCICITFVRNMAIQHFVCTLNINWQFSKLILAFVKATTGEEQMHGHTNVDWSAQTCIHQLFADTVCCLYYLTGVILIGSESETKKSVQSTCLNNDVDDRSQSIFCLDLNDMTNFQTKTKTNFFNLLVDPNTANCNREINHVSKPTLI